MVEAADARQTDLPIYETGRIPSEPSTLYRRFSVMAQMLGPDNCTHARRLEFDQEWAYLEEREQKRLQAMARSESAHQRRAQQAESQAAAEAVDDLDKLRAEARKHGFKDIIRVPRGLTEILEEVVEQGIDTRQLTSYAIEIGGLVDPGFTAQQIISRTQVRLTSEYTDVQIILQKYKGAVYVGTSIHSLDFAAVKIVGVANYRTVLGGTAQAFVLEPAW
jgi:hypothetical protein